MPCPKTKFQDLGITVALSPVSFFLCMSAMFFSPSEEEICSSQTKFMKRKLSNSLFALLSAAAIGSLSANQAESSATSDNSPKSSNFLWYKAPANSWETEALPIGNGRIGAMVFGGDKKERLALNEITLWTGGTYDGGGYTYGPETGSDEIGAFQPFADFLVDFNGDDPATNYSRSLSLDDGISRVDYTKGDVKFSREVFSSAADQVIVMRGTANKSGALTAQFMLKPNHNAKVSIKGNTITMAGTLKNGMKFEARAVIIPDGGTLTASSSNADVKVTYNGGQPVVDLNTIPSLTLEKGTSFTVLISMATDYVMDFKKNWKGTSPESKNSACLASASKARFDTLKIRHIENYKNLFDRVQVDFGKTDPAVAKLPTDERIKAYKTSKVDPELEETLFQFGRYALISSSRPGSLPANLQGLWNDNVSPAWASDYHSNINLQMNYWGAEPANLSECQQPLIEFFQGMAEPCRIASQKEFKTSEGGKVRGWTVRTSQNPLGGNSWQWNIPGSAWYARHMWDHYAFTQNKKYLEVVAYPMMKEISEFWEDHLKELGEGGKGIQTDGKELNIAEFPELKDIKAGTLVAPNGWSPEHGPREDGVAHDQQLIWDLFTNTIAASKILGKDKEWANKLAVKRDKLAAPRIGKEGNLQEWMIDRIAKTDHRHTSHLYAVYPGNQISKEKTPELAQAAQNSLEWRGTTGDSRRSWTWPWRTALWARFHEGDRAHDMVSGLIEHNLLNNMLATHPPMQMDGTLGITGGIAEMLLQSHAGEIVLLPAPTKAWPEGSVKGLKARGNITVDFTWKDGKVTDYKLTSPLKKPVQVRINGEQKTITPTAPAKAQ